VLHGGVVRRVFSARRTAVLAGLSVCALGAVVAASALAKSSPAPGPVSAVEASTGRQLPDNPKLRTGDRVIVTATGFDANANVTVALVGMQTLAQVSADDEGRAVYPFTVRSSLSRSQHALVFSGAPKNRSTRSGRGNITVAVPLTEQWPFRTGGPSHGVSGTGAHQGSSGHGPTSATGVDVLVIATAGLVVLLLGFVLARTGVRRRGH
jgi:hypothetical protein